MIYDPEILIPFAEDLASASGLIIREHYGGTLAYDVKDDNSPVTKADKEVERTLRAMIRNAYPEHGVIGEEFDDVNPEADAVWIIDPIDGTKSFMTGRPIFGTLIALMHKHVPVMGILDQPILGERWIGFSGHETNLNNDAIRARACKSLSDAVLCTTAPDLFKTKERKKFDAVAKQAKYTVYGGDCYSYGQLARGTVDVVIEAGLKPYDFCALRPIVEGSSGIITDWQGKPLTYESNGQILACGDKMLHKELVEMLND